jgi:membrane protein implicated in regulation of membrane protease activity
MKGTNRVFATCTVAGAIVAFLVWFALDLPWQALGIGFLVGLILYANMTQPKSKHKEKEVEIIGL